MPPNGNRVTQREFYDALIGIEARLGVKIDALASEIRSQNLNQGERIVALEEGVRVHQGRIGAIDGLQGTVAILDTKMDRLEAGENRWKFLTGLLGVISGAISGLLAGRQ